MPANGAHVPVTAAKDRRSPHVVPEASSGGQAVVSCQSRTSSAAPSARAGQPSTDNWLRPALRQNRAFDSRRPAVVPGICRGHSLKGEHELNGGARFCFNAGL